MGYYYLQDPKNYKNGELVYDKLSLTGENMTKTEAKKLDRQVRKSIHDIFKKHKNELVLDIDKVVRLVSIHFEDDNYYWGYQNTNGIFYKSSCVSSPIFLKNRITRKDYNYINRVFKLNI